MSWYDDDFYNEPSEFDMLVSEFKESLMKSVKESYVKEMEQLKKENEELKEFRKERQNYSNELARIKSEYEEKEKHLEYKVEQKRFGELLKGICKTGWYAEWCIEKYLPKCDKCDSDRRIHFRSPSGKDMTEPCSCSASKVMYHPRTCELFKIRFDQKYQRKVLFGYTGSNLETDDDSEFYAKEKFNFDKDVSKLYGYDVSKYVFDTEDECQRFCDLLNKNERRKECK